MRRLLAVAALGAGTIALPAAPAPAAACSGATINGTGAADVLDGSEAAEQFVLKAGDNRVSSHGGDDCVEGRAGTTSSRPAAAPTRSTVRTTTT